MITKHFRYVLGGALILGTSFVYPALAASRIPGLAKESSQQASEPWPSG